MDKNEIIVSVLNDLFNFDKYPIDVYKTALQFINLRDEFTNESDRGCALFAASHIDFLLENLLKKSLIGSKKHQELLFGPNGPLCTFSSKIAISYSIGLISSDVSYDIHTIRKIRNEFGHSPSPIDFNNQKIADLCNNLKLNAKKLNTNPRLKFLNAVSGISGYIDASIPNTTPFKEKGNINLEQRNEFYNKIMTEIPSLIEQKIKRESITKKKKLFPKTISKKTKGKTQTKSTPNKLKNRRRKG